MNLLKMKTPLNITRNFHNFNKQKFADELLNTDWSEITSENQGKNNDPSR